MNTIFFYLSFFRRGYEFSLNLLISTSIPIAFTPGKAAADNVNCF